MFFVPALILHLSSIRGRWLRRSADLSHYMYPTWSQTDASSHQNPSNNRPTGTPDPFRIGQNGGQKRPETILEGGRLQNGFWGVPAYAFLVGFGCHLGDFGRHLGPSWAPRGSPNQYLGTKVHQKVEKRGPRASARKTLLLNGFFGRYM